MKVTKRILAVVLTVLMLAMLVPVTASALDGVPTTGYKVTINGKKGFTATVYKIADFDTTTGAFSNFVEKEGTSIAIENAVKAGYTGSEDNPSAALLVAANALPDTVLTPKKVGDPVAFTSATATDVNLASAGVYYVKWTAPGNGTKAQNSVFAVPYYNNNQWNTAVTIAASKTAIGDITDGKVFTNATTAEYITAMVGADVPFTLTGTIPGSAGNPADELKFTDNMTQGLEIKLGAGNADDIAVFGVDDAGTPTPLTATTNYTKTVDTTNKKSFVISFDATQLGTLYTADYKSIKITYTAKLTSTGVVYGNTGNINTLTYYYKKGSDTYSHDTTRTVKTFEFKVKKTDATTGDGLQNAKFDIYSNQACTTEVRNDLITGEKTTPANGTVSFQGLEAGTYYVKETDAPTGYAINTHVYTVVIGDTGAVTVDGSALTGDTITVPDPKIILPNTGGNGTMIFTICGASLIALAGALFLIYRKKSSAK